MSSGSRGRPRSEEGRAAILAATHELLMDVGYDRLAIVDIAARAGVGKQTIYRWWPSKAAVVAECVLSGIVDLTPLVIRASGDFAADLHEWLEESHRLVSTRQIGPMLRGLAVAALTDSSAARGLQDQFTEPLRRAIEESLAAAVRAGTARTDVSADALADLLIGRFVYSLTVDDVDAIARLSGDVVDIVIRGVMPRD
ncbi:TetR/AcrR family transcriptional regulator [Agromyces atrinae]|uniref:TetR/AcrR family transcriptional regulator n=1 Tax=Agromyces atrinae TaxID=592376 RepID=UPI001F589102|nr:TetR/AcrR family transcriptional regulator [Agromyces atrinae]MCI2956864.1 TetR/AcrR family transcriptional regulator [Agromyces atrinae]